MDHVKYDWCQQISPSRTSNLRLVENNLGIVADRILVYLINLFRYVEESKIISVDNDSPPPPYSPPTVSKDCHLAPPMTMPSISVGSRAPAAPPKGSTEVVATTNLPHSR